MRSLTAFIAMATLASIARGHFVFVYVVDNGSEARLVFGHAASPDPSTPATRAEKTALTARDALGKEIKLSVEKGDGNYYRAKLPATKPVLVFGTTEAGVTQRGDNPPMLSWYYPKTILGDPFAKEVLVGKAVVLEIVPIRDGDKVRFRVIADGKPLPEADVTIGLPNAKEDTDQMVKTDKDGLTTGFAEKGRYCVATRRTVERAGEFEGKKYTAIRHTATVVFDFGVAK